MKNTGGSGWHYFMSGFWLVVVILNLVRDAEDAHFSILHFHDGVFDHELAAQVTVILRAHGINILEEKTRKQSVVSFSQLSTTDCAGVVLTLSVWKWSSVSFSYPRGSSALIRRIMVSKHPVWERAVQLQQENRKLHHFVFSPEDVMVF